MSQFDDVRLMLRVYSSEQRGGYQCQGRCTHVARTTGEGTAASITSASRDSIRTRFSGSPVHNMRSKFSAELCVRIFAIDLSPNSVGFGQVPKMCWKWQKPNARGMTMMGERITQIFVRLLQCGATWLPGPHLESLVAGVLAQRARTLPPDESLRLLFRVQAAVYPILGKKAVEYGGGLHTKHRHTRYHEFFANRVQAGQRVLDIGCGIGAVAFDVAERSGASVVGVDLSTENIDTARRRFSHPRVEYQVQDGLKGDLKGKFDVVVLSNVLEHLNDRSAFLAEVLRVANPVKILIRVPLFERDWQVPLKKELGVEWRLDTTHETEYTLESFAKEIEEAGCRILHQEVRWGEIWAEVCAA